jgi:GNAT superfamily N-acetyltransferase
MTLAAPRPLDDTHRLDEFDSGTPSLDDWLRRRAKANAAAGASRTYVVTDGPERVVAYYALAAGALALIDAPGRLKRNMPDPIPMAVLGRLAVDRGWQGRGLGVAMLKDAVIRVRSVTSVMGVRGILVHAISDDAKRFYQRHGFAGTPTSAMTLVMSLFDKPGA